MPALDMDVGLSGGDTAPLRVQDSYGTMSRQMDRTLWLSFLALGLAMALVFTGRAALDSSKSLAATALVAEIERLDGAPASIELSERVTDAAGCLYGFRPPLRSCWYVWAQPSRPDYLMVVAERVRSDATGSVVPWAAGALAFWLLVIVTAWKARRPTPPIQRLPIPKPASAQTPPRRLMR